MVGIAPQFYTHTAFLEFQLERNTILFTGIRGKTSRTLVKALIEYMPAFPLSYACIVTDLTTSTGSVRRPIATISFLG